MQTVPETRFLLGKSPSGAVEVPAMETARTLTYKMPAVSRSGCVQLMNMMMIGGFGSWTTYLPLVKGHRVTKIEDMRDETWLRIFVHDEVIGADVPIIVPSYHTFGWNLKQTWSYG